VRLRLIYPRPNTTNDSVFAPSPFIDAFFTVANRLLGGGLYQPGKRRFLVPPLNLMLVAAYAPPDIDVEIVDERTQSIDFDTPVDAVGVTCMTPEAVRAYAIADAYRERGIPTILGGIHCTVMPDEAARHADSIVLGEAEPVLSRLFNDLRAGRLQKVYRATQFHDLRGIPNPRRDLLDERDYLTLNVVQTTRGCPHSCAFCSVSQVAGRGFRCRPVTEVVSEITNGTSRLVAFVDDNIVGSRPHARSLFQALRPLDIQWYAESTVQLAEDESLLDAAADAGCKILLVGFESLSETALIGVHKRFNHIDRYLTLVDRIHSRNIGVIGTFMLGLDGDDQDQVERIFAFSQAAHLDLAQVSILTPYPGTELYLELERQGRLLTADWERYDTTRGNVVFQPQYLSPHALQDQYFGLYGRLYSITSIARRLLGSRCYPAFFLPYNIRQRRKIATALRDRIVPPNPNEATGGLLQSRHDLRAEE
jgi:radical SAM superfamily enzyme YgiQ (UPF0313 family)